MINQTSVFRSGTFRPALWINLQTAFLGLALLGLFGVPAWAQNKTYYVDSVNGSDSYNGLSDVIPPPPPAPPSTVGPWKTLAKVNGITFQPGDSILFKRGCSWNGNLYPKGNGTATARITWGAYGPATDPKPKIIGNDASHKSAIQFWGRSYTTLQDFEVTNDGSGTPYPVNPLATDPGEKEGERMGILIGLGAQGTARGIRILNNDIHHVRGYSAKANNNNTKSAGIYILVQDDNGSGLRYNFDDLLIEGNYVHDMTAVGSYFKAPGWLSQTDKTWWSTNVVYRNNIFYRVGSDGLTLNGCDAPLVESNVCLDAGYYGRDIGAIAGLWTCICTRNTVFQFNEVARTRNEFTNGLNGDSQAFDVDYGTEGSHTFQYNYTHDNDGGILIVMPKQYSNSVDLPKTTVFRYNLCVNDGRSTNSSSQFPVYPVPGVSTAEIYNNVFYSTRPEGFRIRDNSATTFTNNIFYASLGIYGTKTWYSNNCFWGHNPEVADPYKIVADPQFVGPLAGVGADGYIPGNVDRFKLKPTSPCINRGKNMANNGGYDFWDNLLYSGTADIGIHEAGNTGAPAAVTIIDNPPAPSVVSYSSTTLWTHSTLQADFYLQTKSTSDQVGQWCQVAFNGTNISLYGRKFLNAAKLNVYLDGATTPTAVVDCYSPVDTWRTELCRLTGLSNGAHTVKYTIAAKNPLSTGTYVSLDYFQVASVTPPALAVATDIDDTAGTYAGTWTAVANNPVFYGKTYHKSSTAGDSAVFNFTGTGVRLLGTRAGDCGKVNISIDNGPAVQRDLFLPISYPGNEDLRTPLFEINGLPNTSHTIRATVDATANPKATGTKVEIDSVQGLVGGQQPEVVVDNPAVAGVVSYGGGTWVHSTGGSSYYNGTSSSSVTLGAYVNFSFTGTGASIYGNASPNGGKMNVSIDGGAPVLVDTYASVLAYQSQLFTVSGLASGPHTLTATVAYKNPASGGNYVTLDFFKYQP
jgi:hypothetical protein